VACHQADYDGEHAGSGFPTTCRDCHTPATWDDATFDHDAQFFPIYRGTHQGTWSDCGQCHTTSGDFGVFTCLTCHSRSETDPDHDEVGGYVYESGACLSCHPTGNS
ncbi:MAG: hypothetical protein PVI57_16245, partial [Gemmatimonadota bacterium]